MTEAPREPIAAMLEGGHRNSLGRAEEVVDMVVADRGRLDELVATVTHEDEIVRMRAADALEKVCRSRPGWLLPYVERLLGDVAELEQPSVQWHLAQILQRLHGDLPAEQGRRAVARLERNLTHSRDWIVLNVTMDVLAEWAMDDAALGAWLQPELERLCHDPRPSVSKRASKRLAGLSALLHASAEVRPRLLSPGGGPRHH